MVVTILAAPPAHGDGRVPASLDTLRAAAVPGLLSGRSRIVRSRRQAIVLGKALFWDVQVGSDGMACASCHHHAGADSRLKNQLSPGHPAATRATRTTFEPTGSGAGGGPNYMLRREDFPFHRLADPSSTSSPVLFTTDDVVGSAGTFGGAFRGTPSGTPFDDCARTPDATFNVHGVGTRRVTPRNAPSVINAVLQRRSFWDGRASNVFNGVNGLGERDPDARVWVWRRGRLRRVRLALHEASLASQAVEPPLDGREMSCEGRTFADIGRKLLARRALALQAVHPEDSVLGRYRDRSGNGLRRSYAALVREAFARRFWAAPRARTRGAFGAPAAGGVSYTQMEANFALFFGVAVQLYESTLVSDDAPFDGERGADGVPTALTAQQRRGLSAFVDLHCADCHAGPTFSGAVVVADGVAASEIDRKPIRTATAGSVFGLVDRGFVNTGVVPADDDPGLGGTDTLGRPLSLTAEYLDFLAGGGAPVDPMRVEACAMTAPFALPALGGSGFLPTELVVDPAGADGCVSPFEARIPAATVVRAELAKPDHGRLPLGTSGAFKVPSLRNVELTGPYMHNGGMATLRQVLEFYRRGGNFASPGKDAQFLSSLSAGDAVLADVEAFLLSLTDERVRWERAPFDHPALPLLDGHTGNENAVAIDATPPLAGLAKTHVVELPAVGAGGRDASLGPLSSFEAGLEPRE